MFYLHGRKITLTLSFILVWVLASAQYDKASNNYVKFQHKKHYFGIALGYNQSRYRIIHSDEFLFSQYNVAASSTGGGFNVGIIGNLKLGEDMDIRLIPGITFGDRSLVYIDDLGQEEVHRIESFYTQLPILFRYKSQPYKDMRVFGVVGAKYSFDVVNKSNEIKDDKPIRIADSDFSFEFGGGIQLFAKYFILSPEIRVSHGLGNNLIYDKSSLESSVIERFHTRTITFTLNIEG